MKTYFSLAFLIILTQAAFGSDNTKAISTVRREFSTSKLFIGKNPLNNGSCTVQTETTKDNGIKLTISGGGPAGKASLSFTLSPSEEKSFIQGYKDFGSQAIIYQTSILSQRQREITQLHIHNYSHGNILKLVEIQRQDGSGREAVCNITKILKKN